MRKEKVKTKSFADAMDKCPWAVLIDKVKGGWMCYDAEAYKAKK